MVKENQVENSSFDYKVSVVIPIYNVEEYIEECLNSIAEQSLDSLQVLLIDDGSLDGSSAIAESYAKKYENFFYYRKENGGLGDARNYGIERATGEYICFCDSDDTIPVFAYERLYNLAKKHDLDLVSGDMVRFNSTKTYPSSLHRLAFNNVSEVMLLEDHLELFNDHTSTNKLYRTSFLLDSGLRFPVGMYYEDIPLAIPIQCLAGRIGHLDENVYNYRAREGENRSITQMRTNIDNLRDRIRSLRMVDDYLASHKISKRLVLGNQAKALRVDLRIFIDVLPRASEEYQQVFMDEVVPYIRSFDLSVLDQLPAVHRIKYYYLLQNDLDGLLSYLDHARQIYHAIPVKRVDDRYYGDFRLDIPKQYVDMTNEISRFGCRVSVGQVTIDAEDGVFIEGNVFYNFLNAGTKDDISLRAFLVSGVDGSQVLELPAAICSAQDGYLQHRHSIRHKYIQNLKREQIRYGVHISKQELETLAAGKYRIRLDYSCNGLAAQNVYVAWPSRTLLSRPNALFNNGRKTAVLYSISNQLNIVIDSYDALIDAIEIDDNGCKFYSGDKLLYSDVYIAGNDTSRKQMCTGVQRMRLLTDITESQFYPTSSGVFRVYASGIGELQIQALGQGALSYDAQIGQDSATYHIRGIGESLDEYDSAVFVGAYNGVKMPCSYFAKQDDGSIECGFDLGSDENLSQLRCDTYELYLVKADDSLNKLKVYTTPRRFVAEKYHEKGSNYSHSLTAGISEGFDIKRRWNKLQNTAHKRRVLREKSYLPLYKLAKQVLPIDDHMILFESYWGTQVACNPYGIYKYINEEHKEYHCVWSVTDERMKVDGDAQVVRKGSLPYYMALARSHFLINNVNFEDWYEKRDGQIEIQTTHGSPLKKVGFAATDEFSSPKALEAFGRRMSRWDYLISPGPRSSELFRDNYHYEKPILETGYPRNDTLFERNTVEECTRIKLANGIPADKKLIVYMPTYRVKNKFDMKLDFTALADAMGDDYVIGFRPHHLSAPGVKWSSIDKRVIDLSRGISSEDCYLISDVIITDYSSLMFDYALLNRPMVFFVYDYDAYRDQLRGFNFDFETEAPGPLVYTTDGIIEALKKIESNDSTYSEAYTKFKENYCKFEKGDAGKQVFESVIATH